MTSEELLSSKELIEKIDNFQLDKEHGCTPTLDDFDCKEDIYPTEIIAIMNSGDKLVDIVYRAFKFGHMRARDLI